MVALRKAFHSSVSQQGLFVPSTHTQHPEETLGEDLHLPAKCMLLGLERHKEEQKAAVTP